MQNYIHLMEVPFTRGKFPFKSKKPVSMKPYVKIYLWFEKPFSAIWGVIIHVWLYHNFFKNLILIFFYTIIIFLEKTKQNKKQNSD